MSGDTEAQKLFREAEQLLRRRERSAPQRAALAPARAPVQVAAVPGRPVPLGEMLQFLARFHCLLEAGIPIHNALATLCQHAEPALGPTLQAMLARIESGWMLSRAMAEHPRAFPPLAVHLIAAGEAAGRLPWCLKNLADLLERTARLRQKVVLTLTYPLLVLVFTVFLVVFMAVVIIPREQEMYVQLGTELPWVTRALAASVGLAFHPLVLVLVALQAVLLAASWKTWGQAWYEESVRPRVDEWLLRVPGLGPVLERAALTRMLNGLRILLDAGAVISQTKQVAALAGNRELEKRYRAFLLYLQDGQPVLQALEQSRCFPPMVRHLLASAEGYGQMSHVLECTVTAMEEDLELSLQTMAALLEPIALGFMGLTVGSVVLATVLPTLTLIGQL